MSNSPLLNQVDTLLINDQSQRQRTSETIDRVRFEFCDSSSIYGQIWINKSQYFNQISTQVWEVKIGGFCPAKKWLIDRKGRCLSSHEVIHYSKILRALEEMRSLMNQIESISVLA